MEKLNIDSRTKERNRQERKVAGLGATYSTVLV